MIIPGEKCRLRRWKREDEEALAHHANNRKIWLNLEEKFPHPYTRTDAREWIDFCLEEQEPLKQFCIEVDREPAGGIGLKPKEGVYRINCEIGYWLGEAYWGRGIIVEAIQLMTQYTFDTFDYLRLQACAYGWNTQSVRALEKAGYIRESVMKNAVIKDDKVTDLIIYTTFRK